MAYASKQGRARVSSQSPQAAGVCDRCGGVFTHSDLQWQFDWAGNTTINKRILVCGHCLDQMQPQLRAIILPADPTPIMNPRPQDFFRAETNFRVTSGLDTVNPETGIPVPGGDYRITQGNRDRVTQQTGAARGSLNNRPGTDPNAPGDSDPGLPYGNTTVPKAGN